jgi:hypothetical protein
MENHSTPRESFEKKANEDMQISRNKFTSLEKHISMLSQAKAIYSISFLSQILEYSGINQY